MEPYNPDDHVNQLEEPLTTKQLAATWFDRIKENAIREQMLADLPF